MLDMDFEKKINFIIFKIHEARKKAIAEPEIPKFKLDENGEPVEESDQCKTPTLKKLDPQTVLISATLNSGIKEIARRLNINDALIIDAAESDNHHKQNIERSTSDESQEKVALQFLSLYIYIPLKRL
jgi:superfamily II DNA/RNA helicase